MNRYDVFEPAPFFSEVAGGPEIVEAYWIRCADKVRLRVAYWHARGAAKGTIFVFQGRTENIEKYGRLVNELHKAGYGAFAIDWRGQGLSDRLTDDRMTGHVERFSDYQSDVSTMLESAKALDLPRPWYLVGHSMGACIGLRAVIEGFPASACVFTAPLWGLNLSSLQRLAAWPLSWAAQSVGKGHLYAPGTKGEAYVLHTDFRDNRLTFDESMYEYYVTLSETLVDQQLGGPSLGWVFQALKETKLLSKKPSPDVPCITFCGAEDTIVAIPAVEDRMNRWPKGRFELLENAKHDVLYETSQVRKAVLSSTLALFA